MTATRGITAGRRAKLADTRALGRITEVHSTGHGTRKSPFVIREVVLSFGNSIRRVTPDLIVRTIR